MADSDKKLSNYRVFKSGLEARVFKDIFNWAEENDHDVSKRTSLIERCFHNLDLEHKGYITARDLRNFSKLKGANDAKEKEEESPLTLSGFSDLLSDHMQDKYFPKGHVLYRQGTTVRNNCSYFYFFCRQKLSPVHHGQGDHMYFLNSGSVEVTTKKGFRAVLTQGDFFGEGISMCLDC
jgi:hypothetical protein